MTGVTNQGSVPYPPTADAQPTTRGGLTDRYKGEGREFLNLTRDPNQSHEETTR